MHANQVQVCYQKQPYDQLVQLQFHSYKLLQVDTPTYIHYTYCVTTLNMATCEQGIGLRTILHRDFIKMVAHKIEHWINPNHIRVDIHDAQHHDKHQERSNLLPSIQREGNKRNNI